jgi:hypothetical protein
MADSHEEQLLNDLLRGIAREDARLDAPDLESRVLAAVSQGEARRKPVTTYWVIAAALLAVVLVPAFFRTQPVPSSETVSPQAKAADTTTPEKSEEPRTTVKRAITPRAVRADRRQPTVTAQPARSESPVTQAPVAHSPDEFLPLMPITAQELTGSFQIVRVQMPRASLGALRSPLEQPNELVEADVLLGEDGMARAIRVSAGSSFHPWRSR